jgi:tetratricopeptide (TPR) repeat protein
MADEGVRDLTYEAMADHFAAIPEVDEAAIDSLEDLAPALELIHSLIVLGRYDEAELVFRRYLFRGMTFVLSANHKLMEVLEMFFPDGVDQPPAVSTPFRQANILNQLAAVYTSSGKPAEAIPLFRASIVVARAGKHVRLLKSSLNYYTNVLMLHGDLREAQAAGRRALQFAREIGHSFTETVSLMWLGLVAAAMGAREEAEACFTRGLAFFGPRTVNQASILLHVYRAWAWLWFGDGEAAALAERAIELANRRPYARPLASAHYVGGMAALQQGDFPLANRRLHDALLQSRTTQYVELETAIMAGIARLHLWQQDWPAAAKTLDEVQAILQTAAYRYPSVDALNLRAQLERAQGNTDAAIDAASEAYRQAWCDGPPYAYHWGLEAAKKHLSELGAPYPDMPPFDPSNYEPMPAVKIDPGNGD